jgi:tetraacyldisaccharide 4'-kinase
MKIVRWLLFPFSLIYGLIVIIRNWCYDAGILKSRKFVLPVISVGNLDVGGAGKTPMTEYLINLLKDNHKLATLSRGYGRKTQGFLIAATNSTAEQVGDEPSQFKHKFPDVTVAVCEDRVRGIEQLAPQHDLVVLDDAYQHRAVKPGFSILLFDYGRINEPHLLLPTGNMREPFSGRWRADIIIVSKCPEQLSTGEQELIAEKIGPLPYQSLFFTSIAYQQLKDLEGNSVNAAIDGDTTVFLLTGIANPKPLEQHIKKYTSKLIHHNYPDHHRFSLKNISKLADEFSACDTQKKLIVTTEKDAQRLVEHQLQEIVRTMPFLVVPIGVKFLSEYGPQFDQLIIDYVREHTANHLIH